MKYLLSILVLTFVSLGIKKLYAAQSAQNSCFEHIENKTFRLKMQDTQNAIVLDVRTDAEFKSGKIEGAQNIDVQNASFRAKVEQLDKNKTYLVYCRSGMRSIKASKVLCELGFTKVYNLRNGYMGWK
ncbi:rhodanese-like domain-containing protein [Aureispira anguillae]|uniref:Rhodanese-like domain-containing protein n=1 Tax=Aureispira anguillae TaxID=2864201 RepID=A0A915YLZ8_9BACT|nr:rhodanese-like domain-containing protein [Aureispira anguillae]BDS15555.1 rhodanese-like domain-containing protein [Aureispira anguillae]